jgi:hypothetical protein
MLIVIDLGGDGDEVLVKEQKAVDEAESLRKEEARRLAWLEYVSRRQVEPQVASVSEAI